MTATALSSNTEWNLKVSAIKESSIVGNVLNEFNQEFNRAIPVTPDFILDYQEIYKAQRIIKRRHSQEIENKFQQKILPNAMQKMALSNLIALRKERKNKALLISATGTGKTFLSAFDAKEFRSKKLLFVVHRLNIAKAAMKSFRAIFGKSKTMGIYSGTQKEIDKEF